MMRLMRWGWQTFWSPAQDVPPVTDIYLPKLRPLGWLPALAVVMAVGLLLVALSNYAMRLELAWDTEMMFYGGLWLIFVPAALRLVAVRVHRHERLGLVILLGAALFFPKLLHSPTSLTFYDELLHWRTVLNLIETGVLYEQNPLLPVSAFYPGLHLPTYAIQGVLNVTVFESAIIMVMISRVMLVVILFHMYETLSDSARIAGIGTMIYMTNQSFYIFDVQYAYQTLALPLMFTVLFAISARLQIYTQEARRGWAIVGMLATVGLTLTHHVTSYFMMGYIVLWTAMHLVWKYVFRVAPIGARSPAWTMFGAFVFVLSWMLYVANITIDYLVPVLGGTLRDFARIIAREESGRTLFAPDAVIASLLPPLWERLSVFISIGLIMLILILGLWFVWKYHRNEINYMAMAFIAGLFPLVQALRFTERGPELTARFAPNLYLGLGFVAALGICYYYNVDRRRRRRWLVYPVTLVIITGIFVGGINLSYPRWGRQPGPYLPASDTRSVDPQSVAAARWMRLEVGPYNFFAGDRINGLLINAYGRQNQVTVSFYDIFLPQMFIAEEWTNEELKMICEARLEYIVVDYRLTEDIPRTGFYFEPGEPRKDPRQPLPRASVAKFEQLQELDRIYDSGDVIIYDARRYPCDN